MSIEWLLIRGSGIAAFTLLAGSTIWGLLVSQKLLGRLVRAKPLTWFHESLGIGAIIATVVHLLALSVHDYVPFSWSEILVPGRSDWRPMATAFGIVAFYGLLMVVGSFYVRRLIGRKAWRIIHFSSFGIFVSALLHGLTAGTDSSSLWMLGLYFAATATVFMLMALRMTAETGVEDDSGAPRQPVGRSTTSEPVPQALGSSTGIGGDH